MPILTDSSFIYALFNMQDSRHTKAMAFASNYRGITIIPSITLPEVTFLCERDLGYRGVQQFLKEFSMLQNTFEHISNSDLKRAYEISITYTTSEFDFVDCCIMALSERLNIKQVCTFDRRDFSIFRPRHCEYLELLP